MILSDKSIKDSLKKGEIVIEPFSEEFLQPASYDLHLDRYFMIFKEGEGKVIDVKKNIDNLMEEIEIGMGEAFVLKPGQFALANVKEVTGVDSRHVGRLEGKSSLARIGLLIHATAGFLDPGNKLRLTLELVNTSPLPIKIYEGMKVAQLAFEELDSNCEKPYGSDKLNSKYTGDTKVKTSQMWRNF
ncbi:MAG TPA: dCTP deaminase [Candidatus Dojkabacteria bacterium]|nr:dCTP deaminase [Candidatus Dojkabacteria bacterium]HRY74199.1 dCTP deaminase [Candidatus Dojkabacteria bacterium]